MLIEEQILCQDDKREYDIYVIHKEAWFGIHSNNLREPIVL